MHPMLAVALIFLACVCVPVYFLLGWLGVIAFLALIGLSMWMVIVKSGGPSSHND